MTRRLSWKSFAVVAAVGVMALATMIIAWYRIGDQTDWTQFSGSECEIGTCGPQDFDPDDLTYTIRPWRVSASTSALIERFGYIALIVSAGSLALWTAVRWVSVFIWLEAALLCGFGYLTGGLLRSATMAAIGAIIFGGVEFIVFLFAASVVALLLIPLRRLRWWHESRLTAGRRLQQRDDPA